MRPELIRDIHYVKAELKTGDFIHAPDGGGPPIGYVGDVWNGEVKIYWFLLNPDEVDAESVARHADQERRGRIAVSKREFDRARKIRNNKAG